MVAVPEHEDGETLVELIVALAILGFAGVAIMTGLQFSILGSTLGREQATSGAYVRSLAEAIQRVVSVPGGGAYQSCSPTAPNYLTAAVLSQANLPTGYTATQSTVQTWNPTTQAWGACNSAFDYAQRVTLTVKGPGTITDVHTARETLTFIVRKPCNGALPTVTSPSSKPCV